MKKKCFINWSSGKDAAYALYVLSQQTEWEVVRLLTSVNEVYQRVSMHGISLPLVQRQAAALGLPLDVLYLPEKVSMEEYETLVTAQLKSYQNQEIVDSVYGDILLEDLKLFREQQLATIGMRGIFPLWQRNTKELLLEMIDAGLKTIVICVNEQYLDKSFLGRIIDRDFLADLPANVDPCGENGEFHTFCFDGPMFAHPVDFTLGEVVYKTYDAPQAADENAPKVYGYYFLDLE